ncbi:uncharacterized protein LOC112342289 [Selaginella moellendorffii]|uniref:uncharacterized protein LOC112342289 n=1 Tax=Selaginella moellendorffii TaxID=88036 RepID=UPI000D1CA3A6|nr:uncharacterized protein LOC112342289 [Selaginella moellendorffii]|eukprot:XP_024519633.1 uncharacterized protein LOC112342289 [Selaginella moellendorffii]
MTRLARNLEAAGDDFPRGCAFPLPDLCSPHSRPGAHRWRSLLLPANLRWMAPPRQGSRTMPWKTTAIAIIRYCCTFSIQGALYPGGVLLPGVLYESSSMVFLLSLRHLQTRLTSTSTAFPRPDRFIPHLRHPLASSIFQDKLEACSSSTSKAWSDHNATCDEMSWLSQVYWMSGATLEFCLRLLHQLLAQIEMQSPSNPFCLPWPRQSMEKEAYE